MTGLDVMMQAARAAALALPVSVDLRSTADNHYQATQVQGPPVQQAHLVCAVPGCGQSVCCLSYDVTAGAFIYTLEQVAVMAGAHTLQCHAGRVAAGTPGT